MGTISNSMSPKELGALAPGCEAKIMSDNGKFLGSGEVGEMLVKTPTIMKGKQNNNKRTLKPLQSKKGQKNLGYPRKKAVFFLIKGLLFSRVPQIFWPFLF